jgi:hypothetical protein
LKYFTCCDLLGCETVHVWWVNVKFREKFAAFISAVWMDGVCITLYRIDECDTNITLYI